MSLNNKYITDISPYAVYRSTQVSIISGLRFAEQSRTSVSFILTPDDPYLEIYSELEDRYVRQVNQYFFKEGMLVPTLSNDDRQVLNEKSLPKFRQLIASWSKDKLKALSAEEALTDQQRGVVEKLLNV